MIIKSNKTTNEICYNYFILQAGLLNERADIERKYARALGEWNQKYATKTESNKLTEPEEIKTALNAILEDGLKIAEHRDEISVALSNVAENLQDFVNQNKSAPILNLSIGDSVAGPSFGRLLDEYTDALTECINDVRKAVESKTNEFELRVAIGRKEEMFNASDNPSQRAQSKKSLHHSIEGELIREKRKLAILEAKSKNQWNSFRIPHTLMRKNIESLRTIFEI